MYCRKCGRENADDAVYCQKCGSLLEAEEETRVVRRDANPAAERLSTTDRADPERIFSISPTLKFVKAGYILAAIVAFLLVAVITVVAPAVPWFIVVPIGLALLLIPAFYNLKQRMVKYTLTDTTIEIDSGLLARSTRNIPLTRIQDVTVASGIWQRLLGFGDVVIDNASETGGKVVLHNVDSPRKYADMLLQQLRRLER